jgi:hypothetical protein
MNKSEFKISREKHLDHMVKVVPFIVTAYAIQCYFIMQMEPVGFAVNGLLFLGACLAAMIIAFITYDLTHVVTFHENDLTISVSWLRFQQSIQYHDILKIEVHEPGQSFSTLKIVTKNRKKFEFYFIDDADKIKTWLEQKNTFELQSAA